MRCDERRKVGATAREMLLKAAAREGNGPREEVTSSESVVRHGPSGKVAHYKDLVALASLMPVPDEADVQMKKPEQYRLLGKRIPNASAKDSPTGKPILYIRANVDGRVDSNFVKCPSICVTGNHAIL